jgi:hypothetical protein
MILLQHSFTDLSVKECTIYSAFAGVMSIIGVPGPGSKLFSRSHRFIPEECQLYRMSKTRELGMIPRPSKGDLPVLNSVLGPSRQNLGHFAPAITKLPLSFEQYSVLRKGPVSFLDGFIQMVQPALTTLLSQSSWQL